jgi:hypothetical protein
MMRCPLHLLGCCGAHNTRVLAQEPSVLQLRFHPSEFWKRWVADPGLPAKPLANLPTNRDVVSHVLRKDSVLVERNGGTIGGQLFRIIGTSYMFCDLTNCYWTIELNYEPTWGCQWLYRATVPYQSRPQYKFVSHITIYFAKSDITKGISNNPDGSAYYNFTATNQYVDCLCGRTCLSPSGVFSRGAEALSNLLMAPFGRRDRIYPYNRPVEVPDGYSILVGGRSTDEINNLFLVNQPLRNPWPFFANDTPGRDIFLNNGKVLPKLCGATCVKGAETVKLCPDTCTQRKRCAGCRLIGSYES